MNKYIGDCDHLIRKQNETFDRVKDQKETVSQEKDLLQTKYEDLSRAIQEKEKGFQQMLKSKELEMAGLQEPQNKIIVELKSKCENLEKLNDEFKKFERENGSIHSDNEELGRYSRKTRKELIIELEKAKSDSNCKNSSKQNGRASQKL